ncbi:endoplasmic reticulum vesicle transporter [Chloropicon primus]|uniref:Endoplasmic reticulum vesicle transporter n=1 Tax=Chloropicon primus TaxID=1764295 RepID=A0A5B8MQ76_9CHLO|nr:endoplasmic reticulum vesicle transporter [Chloropicon primus]|eukprot:QDZ22636.1 endoplasmic reticulum vesicle transporter [Chloropicon primus]
MEGSWMPSNVLKTLKRLDAYPKVNEDFFTRTLSGGVITIISSIFMIILFISEAVDFKTIQVVNELSVDRSRGEQMQINLDITLHRMGCSHISIDVMDVSGDYHLHVDDHEILKQRIDLDGNRIRVNPRKSKVGPEVKPHPAEASANSTVEVKEECLSCYGAEEKPGQCCNTCDAVREAYRKKGWALGQSTNVKQCEHDEYLDSLKEQMNEGCHIHGQLQVNKVAGNFHIAPGRSFQQGRMHMHDLIPFGENIRFNTSHTVNTLSFGHDYPGSNNPLDGVSMASEGFGLAYKYFLKVVPTLYVDLDEKEISTNQFSVTEHATQTNFATSSDLPGLFFYYDLSPIKVKKAEQRKLFLHFVTNVCAIVGGVFTISGLADALFYQATKLIRKKIEIGKYV